VKKLPLYILAKNRAARFHFEILEEFEAGIVLTGRETKSIRVNHPKLTGTFVATKSQSEIILKNLEVPEYRFAKNQPHEKIRDRKLLLSKKESKEIQQSLNKKGITAIPLNLHLKNGKIKVQIALARGKSRQDKRETIKKRDIERELRNEMKNL